MKLRTGKFKGERLLAANSKIIISKQYGAEFPYKLYPKLTFYEKFLAAAGGACVTFKTAESLFQFARYYNFIRPKK